MEANSVIRAFAWLISQRRPGWSIICTADSTCTPQTASAKDVA